MSEKASTPKINRLLPQSSESEMGLLSSFMLSPKSIGALCAEKQILAAHFQTGSHRAVYSVLLSMWAGEKPIDFITVTQALRDNGELEGAGGAAFISELFTYLPTSLNAPSYIAILQEKLYLREVIEICEEYSEKSYIKQDDVTEIIAEIQERIAALGSDNSVTVRTMKENIIDALAGLEGRLDDGVNVVKTGLSALDDECGPLERSNLFVIGGQTKAGKSMLAGQIALNIAMNGNPVLYISLEMTERELTLRLLSILARVDTRRVREWSEAEHARFTAAQTTLLGVPFTIITRAYKLSEVVAVCQRAACRPGPPLAAIVLDYAQLTEGMRKGKEERRQQEIAEISRTCKRLAGTHNVLFMLLTQLNDDGRTREARDIENDANLMVEVGHNRDTGERGVKVVLARSAPSGQRLKLRIIPEHTRVEDAPEMDVEPREETKPKKRNWHDR